MVRWMRRSTWSTLSCLIIFCGSLFQVVWKGKSIKLINGESWVEVRLHPLPPDQRDRDPADGLAGGLQVDASLCFHVADTPASPDLIPTSTGGKLHEEIGVVPPVSDSALVLDYLNGPLAALCALSPGDLALSLLSSIQSRLFQYMFQERWLKLKLF